MKRKILSCLLAVFLLTAVAVPTSAALLSGGVAVLAEDAKLIKSGYIGQTVTFSKTDFKQALGTSSIDTVTILTLPSPEQGILKLASSRVSAGQTISVAVLDLLKFVPADQTTTEASFTFSAGNVAGGATIPCTIRLLDKKNEAPTFAAKTAIATQSGIGYYGAFGAVDPEGDSLYYRVVSYPKKGTLTVLNETDGSFCYMPYADFSGKDSFTVVVRDEYGNYSTIQKISVNVKKRTSTLVYADMQGVEAELAALSLTEKGIILGRLSGDNLYFDPDETVSRGDFVVMAMKAAGVSPMQDVSETCFDDNDKIPESIRSYIATAQVLGFVNGSFDGTGLYFDADRAVTRAEAAVILCNILGCEATDDTAVFAADEDLPVWAAPSMGALYAAGIRFPAGNTTVSRADAVQVLYDVMQ